MDILRYNGVGGIMNYVIQSTSNALIKEQVDHIIQNELNVITCDYAECGLSFVLEEAMYLSLFAEKKIILVKNASLFTTDKVKEEEAKQLLGYLQNPNELTTIIFTTNGKIDMRKSITKSIKDHGGLIVLDALKPKDLTTRIQSFFHQNGYHISEKSVNLIMNRCQNNYDFIVNEMNKIMLYPHSNKELKDDDIAQIVSRSLEDNNFRFVDAMVRKDVAGAFRIYEDLMQMKVEPIALISLLFREYRLMYDCKLMQRQSRDRFTMASLLKLQDWQVEKYLKSSYLFSFQELEEKIHALYHLDVAIKTGKIDKKLGLEMFILDI